jgi:hypothetical protein
MNQPYVIWGEWEKLSSTRALTFSPIQLNSRAGNSPSSPNAAASIATSSTVNTLDDPEGSSRNTFRRGIQAEVILAA